MEMLIVVAVFFLFFVLGVPVAAYSALSQVKKLRAEVELCGNRTAQLKRQLDAVVRQSRLAGNQTAQLKRQLDAVARQSALADKPPQEDGSAVDEQGATSTPQQSVRMTFGRPDEVVASRASTPHAPTESSDAFEEAAAERTERERSPASEEAQEDTPQPTAGTDAETEETGAGQEEPREAQDEAVEEPADTPGHEPPRATSISTHREPNAPTPASTLDLETTIGTTWVLRAGLGILAIALALFARTVVTQLPNSGKVALAYAASLAFFGLGKFFEEKLERFARPVMAGGLSFAFFVAFAAYFVPQMRAVPLGVSIGWMLFSTVTILVAAERWKSEPTAILAIVLGHLPAQVASSATDLYSLVMIAFLAATAIMLLLRHNWVSLGLVAVVASYGAHLLWFLVDPAATPSDSGAIPLNLAFLTSYYVIFQAADLRWWRLRGERAEDTDDEVEVDPRHAHALGPVNLALYAIAATYVFFAHSDSPANIEWYYITLGVLQCGLAWLYRKANHEDFVFYPVFGAILWTIGMFAALDALVLNLALASQALILLLVAHRTGLRMVYGLAQAAMIVTFVHYLAYPPPDAVTLPIFFGGLGIATVYFAKAALEERWYGAFSLISPAHAALGAVVVLREAFAYFDGDPGLGFFVFGAQAIVLLVAAGLGSVSLLLGLTVFAASSPLVVESLPRGSSIPALVLLLGLAVSAMGLVRPLWTRFGEGQRQMVFAASFVVATMALVSGGFIVADRLTVGLNLYLTWLILPVALIAYHWLAEVRWAAVRGDDATTIPDSSSPTSNAPEQPADNRFSSAPPFDGFSLVSFAGIAVLVLALTGVALESPLGQPFSVATWAILGAAAAGWTRSRGMFVFTYTVLLAGYVVFLIAPQPVIGLVAVSAPPHPALASYWLAPYLVAVALVIAIGIDRGLKSEAAAGFADPERTGGLVLAGIPYLLGLSVLGLAGQALLPEGGGLVAPGVVAAALMWKADTLRMPRSVLSAALWLALSHVYVFAEIGDRGRSNWVEEGLWLLLLFALITLLAERAFAAWAVGERQENAQLQPVITWSPLILVTLAAITAMATVSSSVTLGTSLTTAGWSLIGGAMMAAGFALKSANHRRVALAVLGISIVRVFIVDTVGLSDAARIGAFFVLGLILIGIALLYARFSEELKSWL